MTYEDISAGTTITVTTIKGERTYVVHAVGDCNEFGVFIRASRLYKNSNESVSDWRWITRHDTVKAA